MAFGIINKTSECIFRIKQKSRIVEFFGFLKFDMSSGREQNIKINEIDIIRTQMIAQSLYLFCRQFVGQGFL
jgi:hypothetical protein